MDLCSSALLADGVALYVVTGVHLNRVTGRGLGLLSETSFVQGKDVAGKVWADGEALVVSDYFNWSERTMQQGISVLVGLPIRLSGTVAGVLLLMYGKSVQFLEAQSTYAQRLADLCATALENGFLRRQFMQQTEARAAAVATLSEFDERLRLFESAVLGADESVLISEVLESDDGEDSSARIVFVNQAFTRTTGYTVGEVIGQSPSMLRGALSDVEAFKAAKQTLLQGFSAEIETVEYRKDGSPLWVQLSIVPMRNEQQRITHRVSWRRDITERKRNELLEAYRNKILELALQDGDLNETLQILTALLEQLFPGSSAGVFMRRGERVALQVAPNWRPLVRSLLDGAPIALGHGTAAYSMLEGLPAVVENVQDDPRWSSMDRAMLMSGVASSWAVPVVDASGKVIAALELLFSQPTAPLPSELDRFENVARLATLVIERSTLIERLDEQASRDSLTNLPNRFGVERHLEQALLTAAQRGSKLAVLQIDLDGFRRVNDTLGHEVGDDILKTVAARWKTILPSKDILARPGGDEFTLLVNHLEHPLEAETLATEMLSALSHPLSLRGVELFLSASIGAAVYPDDGQTANILLRNADTAMNTIKRSGKSAYRRFDPSMNAAAKERIETEVALRRALERNEFVIRYQPQVNARGQVVFVEALLYWQHPREGVLPPGRFLPTALDSGLIVPMGEWILRQACLDIGSWRKEGINVSLAVNIDVQQLMKPDFSNTVSKILEQTQFDPRYLELEITESALMHDTDVAVERLQRLRAKGIQTAIDDFGTGYSSLAYLQKLPLNCLKVDRSFVSHLEANDSGWSLVQLIVTLAKHLGMEVVAEGVETKTQFDAIKGLNVDRAQGYYFSKPIPATELLPKLRSPRPPTVVN